MLRRRTYRNSKAQGYVTQHPVAQSLIYDGSAQVLSSAGIGTGTMYYRLGDSGDFGTEIPSQTNAGTWTLYYYAAESSGYTKSETYSISVSIGKADTTYTAPSAKSLTYSGSAQELLNAGSVTGGTIQYSADDSSWSTTIPSQTDAGSYASYWRIVGDSNHNDKASASINTTIAKANQDAPTATGATTTYNTTATATATGGGGQGSIEWSNGNTQTSVGSKSTQARWSGNANYNASEWSNAVTLTMNKAAGSVTTAPTNRGVTYSGSNQNLVNAGSGTGTMYYRLGTSGSFSTSIPVASGAGSYTVYYYAAESTNYTQSSTGSLTATIAKANQSAPTAYGATVTYGSTATASASGGGGQGSIEWSNGSSRSAVGSQNTQARWSGNANYNASGWSNAVTLTVNKATGSVTTNPTAKSLTYNAGAQYLVNAGSGTGTMYYSLSSSSGFSTSIPTGTNAGSYTVYYYAAASTNYTQSATGSVAVSIGKANQNAPTAYGSSVWSGSTATATASGGGGQGSIEWSNGNTRTALGSQSTQARWSGNANYNASGWSNSVTLAVNDPYAGKAYVDLGLPSGKKWATMNIGASNQQNAGNYYMYGKGSRTYVSSDSAYTGTENPLSDSADTARQVWGGLWRTPTKAEWEELINNTTWKTSGFDTYSGVKGRWFYSKTNAANKIFIPAAGRYVSGSLKESGTNGHYRTSTPNSSEAYRCTMTSVANTLTSKSRTDGYTIRAIIG